MTALKMAPVQKSAEFWHPEGTDAAAAPQSFPVEGVDAHLAFYRPEVLDTIEREIDAIGGELRALSLDIHRKHDRPFLVRTQHSPTGAPHTYTHRAPRAQIRRDVRDHAHFVPRSRSC